MNSKPLIVGITGAFGSGKSTAASYFETKTFQKVILSSFLEKEAKKRGFKKITRKLLQDIGNQWREKYGKGILARKTLEYIKENKIKKTVVDGIRNIGEIEEFREYGNFILVSVIADRKIRFNRLKKLKRRENLTLDLFNKLDYRDLGVGEKETGLQVAICVVLADYFISNNGNVDDFQKKLRSFLKEVKKEI